MRDAQTVMEQHDLATWEELEERLRWLEQERTAANASPGLHISQYLFRGQRDAEWKLETTLDRRLPPPTRLSRYYRLVWAAKPQVETFTGRTWEKLQTPSALADWAADYDNLHMSPFPGYEFLVYLRHHGFPSPLLDWTRSPYVAAHFAFTDASSDRVAIYGYCEYAGGGKSSSSNKLEIRGLGPYIRSHSRHYLQQSEYTICCQFIEGNWCFVPHENVYAEGSVTQDRLWKFTLPATERLRALQALDAHNLNTYSLFQTDEALLETIALREIEFRAG